MKRSYFKHGKTNTKIYRIWISMRQRCQNSNDWAFNNYGRRGIRVSKSWLVFTNFYKDMGDRPRGKSLERKNNNMGYSKRNCIWAKYSQQMRNTRRNRIVEFDGVRLCVADWAIRLNLPETIIRKRLRMGWPTRLVLLTPSRGFLLGDAMVVGGHYRGVSKKRSRWQARIGRTTIGCFSTREEAAKAYKNALKIRFKAKRPPISFKQPSDDDVPQDLPL